MSGDLEDKLGQWMRESGAALELRTARALHQAGLPVDESSRYRDGSDPANPKFREVDVSTVLEIKSRNQRFKLVVTIECKDNPEATWVGVRPAVPTTRNMRELTSLTTAGGLPRKAREEAAYYLTSRSIVESSPLCQRVTQAWTGRGKDPAYDALRQAGASAWGRLQQVRDVEWDPDTDSSVGDTIALAVVLITGQLFSAELDENAELVVKPANRLDVAFSLDAGESRPIVLMREAALPEFARSLRPRT